MKMWLSSLLELCTVFGLHILSIFKRLKKKEVLKTVALFVLILDLVNFFKENTQRAEKTGNLYELFPGFQTKVLILNIFPVSSLKKTIICVYNQFLIREHEATQAHFVLLSQPLSTALPGSSQRNDWVSLRSWDRRWYNMSLEQEISAACCVDSLASCFQTKNCAGS